MLAVLLLPLLASSPTPAARAAALAKVSGWVVAATEGDREADFLVVLSDQADLSGAASLLSREAKGRFVLDALAETARRTQAPLLGLLRSLGVPHQPFYAVNAIAVTGTREAVLALAARPEVSRVEGNPRVAARLPSPGGPAPQGRPPSPAEPGITQTRAPEVWASGITGQGIVVGAQDTGYSWTHPALEPAYRGWNGTSASHDYNWHDAIHTSTGPCGENAPAPCDDYGHGTHTLGTAVGLDGTNKIGMAPGARWIGCRNMNSGNGSPSTYLECLQFFLAPYPVGGSPSQGDPARAPNVTNNSWACPSFEGCGPDTLRLAAAAQRAAGIFSVASAGNDGPGCSTVTDPPAIYGEFFSVGALVTGTDGIAVFSSRGPVTADGSGRTKPDIVAPGTDIRSSYPGGAYVTNTGTSMAGPHVAGAVALLWSAQPALLGQVDQTERILADSAVPIASTACGSTGLPNNAAGWGRLDVKAAVDLALVRPVISGLSVSSGLPAGGTAVTISGANFAAGASVTFGGVASSSVAVPGPGSLVAVSPPHATGLVDVAVTNPSGQAGTLPKAFRYLSGVFFTLGPCRVLDTRDKPDATFAGPALQPNATRSFSVPAASCGIPADARAVSANIAVTRPTEAGYLTLYPADVARPLSSSINFAPGQTRSNNAILQLSADGNGSVAVFTGSTGTVDLILDVNGYFR